MVVLGGVVGFGLSLVALAAWPLNTSRDTRRWLVAVAVYAFLFIPWMLHVWRLP